MSSRTILHYIEWISVERKKKRNFADVDSLSISFILYSSETKITIVKRTIKTFLFQSITKEIVRACLLYDKLS